MSRLSRSASSGFIPVLILLSVAMSWLASGCTSDSNSERPMPVDSVYSEGTPYTTDVPYVATPQKVVEKMLAMAEVTEDDVVYDLGSGDGRMIITAAQQHGARGVGIEIVPELVEQSRSYARLAGVADRVDFYRANLFDTDLSEATVLSIYLLPDVIEKLLPKIRREMDPGDRIVSHNYGDKLWTPDRSERVGPDHVIHLWVIRDSTSIPIPSDSTNLDRVQDAGTMK